MRRRLPNPCLKYFANPVMGRYEPPNQLLASFPWSALEMLAPVE